MQQAHWHKKSQASVQLNILEESLSNYLLNIGLFWNMGHLNLYHNYNYKNNYLHILLLGCFAGLY